MPTKKGIRKPRHGSETKKLAVSLYNSSATITLREVAEQLNAKFHFDPLLSSDSVGRWVQENQGKMKRSGDLLWVKRREKYGKSGMKKEKRELLSRFRRNQWSDPRYKKKMSELMRRIPLDVESKIVKLYREGITPSKIKQILRKEQMVVPSQCGFYQILHKNKVRLHHIKYIDPLESIINVPCFGCMANKEVSVFKCCPASCPRLDEWVFTMGMEQQLLPFQQQL